MELMSSWKSIRISPVLVSRTDMAPIWIFWSYSIIMVSIVLPGEHIDGENEQPSLPAELHVGFSTSSLGRQNSFPAFQDSLWRTEDEVPSYILTNRK